MHIFWIASFILGNIASKLAWGAVSWSEPRFKVTVIILLIQTGRVLHPENPFLASGFSFQIFFIMITILFLLISVLAVRWLTLEK